MRRSDIRLAGALLLPALVGCPALPEPPCLVGRSETSAYVVQLRPSGAVPAGCPQGQQYQMLAASQYATPAASDPNTVTFQPIGSSVDPPSGAQASGVFESLLTPPGSDVCTITTFTPATDDGATPVEAPMPVGATTYVFSEMRVLSDAAHRGNQFQARATVDYGIAGCAGLTYVAQGVFPVTACLDDTICLPDPVATDVPPPAGRGLGSGLTRDYRAFCNKDPALLDNPEVGFILGLFGAGRAAYTDPDGNVHDVGVCFLAEPFPSLCPPGSTLSTTGPCIVGPGSNPH